MATHAIAGSIPNAIAMSLIDILELTEYTLRYINLTVYGAESHVPVQVDLGGNFASHNILIELNGIESFRATLSESVPFAGPAASFATSLPRGANQLYIFWQDMTPTLDSNWQDDTVAFHFGDAEKYFMALNIDVDADTLIFRLQDTPFLYL